ncbi:MAG: RagB/SusD family nutrient uptake outer membrane protein [Rikenellaceae bacterium]
MKRISIFLLSTLLLCSCEDLLTPAIENNKELSDMYTDPDYAMGLLGTSYVLIPYVYQAIPQSDVATDDAVSNDYSNGYLKMATGSWTSSVNPMSQWQTRRNAIQYTNLFLANCDDVQWSSDELLRAMFNDRLKGEAYAMRALQMYFLLLAHGGWSNGGELLGVPIVTEPESGDSNFNVPRDSFQACVDQIFADLQVAEELLPYDYKVHDLSEIPQRYIDLGVSSSDYYDRVNGASSKGRISGRIAQAIRVQVALLAASPAYSEGTDVTYEDVAEYAAQLLNTIGGESGLSTVGLTWYCDNVDNVSSGDNPDEIIWRSNVSSNNDLESENFPPTLYGNGRVNPTQNLVDAFPMLNGYPIDDEANSGYNDQDPYSNRDPRLATYVLLNNTTQGSANTSIVTGTYGTTINSINRESGQSTRTGYYLRKLTRASCNPNPTYNTTAKHYTAYIRYTEMFLAYAEAANEAYGPTGSAPSASYSAYDVIKAIRTRAGIDSSDPYLESCASDIESMRELIRNERRLELCFENIRFWDLRRWMCDLTETARGVEISQGSDGSTLVYKTIDVEKRNYQDYMNYGPVPYEEICKWTMLEQNRGW